MLLCLMAISAGFVSCSDDDESFDSNALVGTWEVTRYEGYYYDGDGKRVNYDEPGEGEFITFNADGTGYEDYDSFEWSLSGNRLSVSYDGEVETGTVTRLTATEMIIESSGRDEDGDFFDRTYLRRAE